MEHENSERPRTPFDRQAALQELERFRQEIERYRAQRSAVGDQFDSFIRSFNTPPDVAAPGPSIATAPAASPPPVTRTPPTPADVAVPQPPSETLVARAATLTPAAPERPEPAIPVDSTPPIEPTPPPQVPAATESPSTAELARPVEDLWGFGIPAATPSSASFQRAA